jgi:hypothetical protein
MRIKSPNTTPIPIERVIGQIRIYRSQKVLLDFDLARLYGVTTGNLNKAVKRNVARFPSDFLFQVTPEEATDLIFRDGRSRSRHGGRRKPLFAFTEQGIAMLSSVLNSPRAIQVNIAIMRAFIQLREAIATNEQLASQFAELEKRVDRHDEKIQDILDAIREMLAPAETKPRREIGFHVKRDGQTIESPDQRRETSSAAKHRRLRK